MSLIFNIQSDILNMLINPKNNQPPEFVMEVTDKTRADVKVNIFIIMFNKKYEIIIMCICFVYV